MRQCDKATKWQSLWLYLSPYRAVVVTVSVPVPVPVAGPVLGVGSYAIVGPTRGESNDD